MHIKLSRLLCLASLAPLLLSAGCHGQKTPAVPPIIHAARPLAIPVLPAPADPGVIGYVKVRDPRRLVAEVGQDQVQSLLNAKDLDINLLRPGTPATLVMWGPDGFAFDKVPLAAFVALQKTPPGFLKDKEDGVKVLEDLTFLPITPTARDHAKAASSLLPLCREPGPWDAQLHVVLSAITRNYGTQLHIGLGALQGAMAAQSKKPGAPDPQAIGSLLTKMLARIEQMESYSLGLSFLPEEIEVEMVLRDKDGGAGGPIPAPDLAQFMPVEDIRMQWNLHDLAGKMNTYLDWYMPLLASTTPGLVEPMRALFTDMGKLGDAQTAVALSFDANVGMRGAGLWLTKDPEAYLAIIRRSIDMFNQQGVKDSYRTLGMELSATRQSQVRKVYGWPVDRFSVHITPTKDARPEQRLMFDKMPILAKLTHLDYEVMRMGSYVLFSFNAPIEALAERLLRGHGDLPLRAAHNFPAGGTLYVDVNVEGLVGSFKGMLPPDAAAKIPDPKSLAGTVTMFSYDGGAASDYRVRVPRTILTALAKKGR